MDLEEEMGMIDTNDEENMEQNEGLMDQTFSHTQSVNKEVKFVVKNGDDLRQDQLVLQVISIIDVLLKKIHFDFRFTTYKCIACSPDDGLMEFVNDSATIQ